MNGSQIQLAKFPAVHIALLSANAYTKTGTFERRNPLVMNEHNFANREWFREPLVESYARA